MVSTKKLAVSWQLNEHLTFIALKKQDDQFPLKFPLSLAFPLFRKFKN